MQRNSASVLVVDDEPIIRRQLSRALHSVGLQCDYATDGEDALRKVAGHHYDMVITDLRMPERNGHSLAVSLLHQLDRPRIVALTGITEPRLREDLLARGVDAVVHKPVNYFDFALRMKQLLKDSQPEPAPPQESKAAPEGASLQRTPLKMNCETDTTRKDLELRLLKEPVTNEWMAVALRWIDWYRFPNPPEELRDFLQRLSRPFPYDLSSDRRRENRVKINEVAVAIALNERQAPVGQPFKLFVRDLSPHGIGLVHTERVEGQLGLVWNTKLRSRVVAPCEIVRCQQLGEFFEMGARLFSRDSNVSDAP